VVLHRVGAHANTLLPSFIVVKQCFTKWKKDFVRKSILRNSILGVFVTNGHLLLNRLDISSWKKNLFNEIQNITRKSCQYSLLYVLLQYHDRSVLLGLLKSYDISHDFIQHRSVVEMIKCKGKTAFSFCFTVREHSFNKVRKFLVGIFRGNEAFFERIAKAMGEKNNEVSAIKTAQNAYIIL